MKKKGLVHCFLFLVFLVFANPLFASTLEENPVVAVVNGSELRQSDLNQEFWKLLPANRNFHGNVAQEKIDKLRAEAMEKLVESELQYQDALAKGMKLSEQELNAEIEKLSSRYKKKSDFDAAIVGSGFDRKGFGRFVERTVLVERIRFAEVDKKAVIVDSAVKDFYQKNKGRYSKPQEYRARQILIKIDPAASEAERTEARKRADAILKKIKEGASFAEVAAQDSDDLSRIKGGDMGYFHAGQTVAEFDAELEKMKAGQVSNLIETIFGYHIIQLVEKRDPRQLPYEEVAQKIKTELVDEEKSRLTNLWMTALKNKAVISYPGKK